MRRPPRSRARAVRPIAALGLLAALCSCSRGGPETAAAGAEGVRDAVPLRARSMEPEVVRLRRLLDMGRLEEARPILRAWSERLGVEGELLSARAAALAGDPAEASRRIESARALDPSDPDVYATAAEVHAAAGRVETAREEIRRGVERAGATPELLRAQGVLFLCQTRGAAKGLELIEGALARDPELPFVDRALGQAHLLRGKEALAANRVASALEHARRSLEHDPEDIDARRFFADVLSASGELTEAAGVLEELVQQGQPLQSELALLWKRAGLGELVYKRREAALECFRRSRELGLVDAELGTGARLLGEAAEAAVEEGVAAYAREDFSAARERFERALALDPDSLSARNHLGVVLFQQKDFAGAAAAWRNVLDTALAEDLELPEPVHLNLAKALYQDQHPDEARAVVAEYLAREPEGRWAEDSRAMLRNLEE